MTFRRNQIIVVVIVRNHHRHHRRKIPQTQWNRRPAEIQMATSQIIVIIVVAAAIAANALMIAHGIIIWVDIRHHHRLHQCQIADIKCTVLIIIHLIVMV